MNKEKDLEFCLRCGCDKVEGKSECPICKSKNFLYGKKFDFDSASGKITCECGDTEFNFKGHTNANPRHYKHYSCSNCGNSIGIESYCDFYY